VPRVVRRTKWLAAVRGQEVNIDLVSNVFGSFILLGIVAFVPYISWLNPTVGEAPFRNYNSMSGVIVDIFWDNPRAFVDIVFRFLGFVFTVTLVPTIVALLLLLPISYFALRRAERLLRWGRTARAAVTTVSGPPTRSDWKFTLEFHDDAGSLVQTWTTGSRAVPLLSIREWSEAIFPCLERRRSLDRFWSGCGGHLVRQSGQGRNGLPIPTCVVKL
jgi:hypothetical protein